MDPVTILTTIAAVAGLGRAYFEAQRAKRNEAEAGLQGAGVGVICNAIERAAKEHPEVVRSIKKHIKADGVFGRVENEVVNPVVRELAKTQVCKGPRLLSARDAANIGRVRALRNARRKDG